MNKILIHSMIVFRLRFKLCSSC